MNLQRVDVRQIGTRLEHIARDHVKRYEFASKHVKGRILDAACGVGYGSKMLYALGNDVVGIDIDPEVTDFAHKYWTGPEYIVADLNFYVPDRKYDGIISVETIEHLSNPHRVLKTFREVCEGSLIASVPNEKYFPFKAEDFDHEYPHQRHYHDYEFDALMEEAGFEIVSRHCQVSKKQPEVIDGTEGRYLIYICR